MYQLHTGSNSAALILHLGGDGVSDSVGSMGGRVIHGEGTCDWWAFAHETGDTAP